MNMTPKQAHPNPLRPDPKGDIVYYDQSGSGNHIRTCPALQGIWQVEDSEVMNYCVTDGCVCYYTGLYEEANQLAAVLNNWESTRKADA